MPCAPDSKSVDDDVMMADASEGQISMFVDGNGADAGVDFAAAPDDGDDFNMAGNCGGGSLAEDDGEGGFDPLISEVMFSKDENRSFMRSLSFMTVSVKKRWVVLYWFCIHE